LRGNFQATRPHGFPMNCSVHGPPGAARGAKVPHELFSSRAAGGRTRREGCMDSFGGRGHQRGESDVARQRVRQTILRHAARPASEPAEVGVGSEAPVRPGGNVRGFRADLVFLGLGTARPRCRQGRTLSAHAVVHGHPGGQTDHCQGDTSDSGRSAVRDQSAVEHHWVRVSTVWAVWPQGDDPGIVETATGNKTSLAMCKQFWEALHQGYVKVERYYLGPEAFRFLEQGGRLTPAVQCPRNMDLVLPKKKAAAKAPAKRKSGGGAPRRKSLEATWKFLASEGEKTPRRANRRPFVPDAMPNIEDEQSGFTYYKYRLEDANNTSSRTATSVGPICRSATCGPRDSSGASSSRLSCEEPTSAVPGSRRAISPALT